MLIFVKFKFTNDDNVLLQVLDVEPNAKIEVIAKIIEEIKGIPTSRQRLFFHGKEIAIDTYHHMCLSDYDIRNEDTLECHDSTRRFANGNSDSGSRRGANRGGRQYTSIGPSADDTSLPYGWSKLVTNDGRTCYQNNITKQTQWEKPTWHIHYGGTGDVFRGHRGGRGASYRGRRGGGYRGNRLSAYRGGRGGRGGRSGRSGRGCRGRRGRRGSGYRGGGYMGNGHSAYRGGTGRGYMSHRNNNYGNQNYGNGNGSQKSEAEHEEEESYSQSGSIGDVEQYNINSNINDNISDDLPAGASDEQDIKNEEKLNEPSKICEEIEKLATVVQKIAEQMTQQQKQLNEMTNKLNTTAEKMVQQHMVTNRDKKHGIDAIIHGYIRNILIKTEMPSQNILTEICTLVQFYAALSKDKKHKKQPSDVDIWQRIINDKSFSVDNEKVYLLISNVTIRMKNTKFIKQKIFEFLANIITLDDIFINDNNEFELRIHDQKYYLHAQLRMNSANAVQKAVNEAEKHIQNAVNKSAELMAWKIRQWINYENKHKRNKKMHNNRQQNQNQNRNFNTPSNFNISPNFNIPSNFNIPPNFNIPLNYNYATGILPNVPPIYYYNQNNNQ